MRNTLFASILTAFGASLCCTGPALMLLFGSTALGMFSFLEPIRPYASVLALGILGFAYYKVFKKQSDENCCEVDKEKAMKQQKIQKRTLFGITPVVLALILFPYYSGFLYTGGDTMNQDTEGIISEWTIEGMTCEGCAKGLQGGMAAVKGILKCKVDYNSKSMICAINENELKTDAIPGLVNKFGYKAIPKEFPSSERKIQASKKKSLL